MCRSGLYFYLDFSQSVSALVADPEMGPDLICGSESGFFFPDPGSAIHNYLDMKKIGLFLQIIQQIVYFVNNNMSLLILE
jgi:hypothetical protein